MRDIYTIGYSCFTIDNFIKVLRKYNISSVIDVRSNPISKFYENYNKNNIEPLLRTHGIIYRNYKNEFGARQEDKKYYSNGYLNFEEYSKSKSFLDGVQKIITGMNLNYTFVFMCAEKDPSVCHRSILVARKFNDLGYNVKNILEDSSYKTQASIEQELVEQYFPNRNQLSLFSDDLSFADMVVKSYRYRNSEIGYRIDEKRINVS